MKTAIRQSKEHVDPYRVHYRVAVLGGSLNGILYIPEIKHWWMFEVCEKFLDPYWLSYGLVYKIGQPKSMEEFVKDRKQDSTKMPYGLSKGRRKTAKAHDGIEPQATFKLSREFGQKGEDHCDVQTFIKWHEREFKCRPYTIRSYG